MKKIQRIQYSVWYDYLCGHFSYDFACDVWELLLPLKDELRHEGE